MLAPDSGRRLGWVLAACLALALLFALASTDAGAAQKQEQTAGAKGKQASGSKGSVSAPFCRRGEALLGLGRVGEAEAAFSKEMETGTSVRCARKGLAKIGSKRPCAVAKALLLNGEKAEANKAYLESLKTKPTKKCAKAGVAESSEPDLLEKIKTTSEDVLNAFGPALGAVALGVAIIAILVLLLLNLQARIPGLRNLPPVAAIRRPALSIDSLGDNGLSGNKLGSATTALLKERVEPGSGPRGLKVTGTDSTEESWIERVGEIGEQAKAAAAVLALAASALPRRRIKLSGEIQPKGKAGGPGISVELDRKFISEGSTTIWARDFFLPVDGDDEDEVDVVRRLVTPAAAWVSHVVTEKTEGEPSAAKRAMSWARFKAGYEWEEEGNLPMAKKLYTAALTDKKNYAARINLGSLRGGDGEHAEAVKLIEEGIAIIKAG